MFQRLVLAHDLTPTWDEIVACAGEFKALGCTEIILTHVVTVLYLGGMEGALREEGQEHLEAQKAQLESQGFTVDIQIPTGLPAQSLNEVARCHGADLIVMGSHGKSPWREAVLGCVTCAVLHNIEFPTLLLPVQVREDRPDGYCRLQGADLFRHVLYLTDFSEISARAGEYLIHLAPRGLARVTVLHALDLPPSEHYPPGYQEKAEAEAREALQVMTGRLQEGGIPAVEQVFTPDRPLPAILPLLESRDISLIVMGTQGKGYIKEIFLGSVAQNVSRLAPCPVLLIPPATR